MKKVLWGVGLVLAVPLLYVAIVLTRGTIADWQPEGISSVTIDGGTARGAPIVDSVISFLTWNVGYAGLGAEADFFLDGGDMYLSRSMSIRMPEADVQRYREGIAQELSSIKADFFLLQEVDSSSARSYYDSQLTRFRKTQPTYAATFAPNYINERVPIPILEPWHVYGDVYSGLLSLSRTDPATADRHALPGSFPWPDRLFQLDRCALVQRHALADGRELTVVNVHLSAYDDGTVKRDQLEYLAEFLKAEAAAGHLVVVGGDWNLVPPNFRYDQFIGDPDGLFTQQATPMDFPTEDWTFVYDAALPTNRKINAPYSADSSFVTTIDYFLLSPGLRANKVKVVNQDFKWSDHQPVYMELLLE